MGAMVLVILATLTPALAQQQNTSGPQPARTPHEMLQDARSQAIREVLRAARADNPLLRMRAIEAAQPVRDRVLPLVRLGMGDKNPAVRFGALVTVGKLKLTSLGRAAAEMATDDDSSTVRAAAAFAADQCGRKVDLQPIIKLLFSQDPGERGNAALLLGLSGNASAIKMLQDAARAPMPRVEPAKQSVVRVQIAEALVRLGHDQSLQALHGSAYSEDPAVSIMSAFILGRLHDESMRGNFVQLLRKDPIQLRLAGAVALAQIDRAQGLPVVRILLEGAASKEPSVRQQAAFGLADMARDPRAAGALVTLLHDPDPSTRLAAAAGTLRALSVGP